jgi:hypothetical protein
MYRKSKKVLTTLVVIFLALSTMNGTIAGIVTKNSSAGKHPLWMENRCIHWQTLVVLILSGNYVCSPSFDGNGVLLVDITWIIGIAWEVLALSLAVWVAVKHLRELRQSSSGGILEDCFTVLIKTHVVYFAR